LSGCAAGAEEEEEEEEEENWKLMFSFPKGGNRYTSRA
jgi:hypothetical protein